MTPTDPSELACNNEELLTFWLERFVLEVRNKHGNEYSSISLHHIVVGNFKKTLDQWRDEEAYQNWSELGIDHWKVLEAISEQM